MANEAPTLGLAMIVGGADFQKGGNGPKQLRACLDSARPYVDEIVLIDTGTNGVAQKLGKQFKAKVHTFPWVQDFAAARNESFKHITSDYILWLDHDDVLEEGKNLKTLLASMPDQFGGIWLKYLYGFDEYGNVTTIHERERVLRRSVGWTWKDRLHETCVPSKRTEWIRSDEVRVRHAGHKEKENRNLEILKLMLEEDPTNLRIWMHLGNQYFSSQAYYDAERWFREFYTHPGVTPIDRWQCMIYGGHSQRYLGDLQGAEETYWNAVRLFPSWTEGWLGLAWSRAWMKDYDGAITFAEIALRSEQATTLLFINSLDYLCAPHEILSIAYGIKGEYDKAIYHCNKYLETRPQQKEILAGRQRWSELKETSKAAEGVAILQDVMKQDDYLYLLTELPESIAQMEPIRDIMAPIVLKSIDLGTQPKAVIYCGESLEEWSGVSLNQGGIGGSETAVVEIAERLAKDGWQVIVYGNPGANEGPHNDVYYTHWKRFRPQDTHPELFIGWRNPMLGLDKDPVAKERWLWLHDLNSGSRFTEEMADGFDRILGVSEFHRDYLRRSYNIRDDVALDFIPNGINLGRFEGEHTKKRFRAVYSSSPDRGLLNLLNMWQEFRGVEPTAELHIFYGWETFDRSIANGARDLLPLKQAIQARLNQEGVHWRGRLPQDELAKEFMQADLWLYPTSHVETFCITALEALAADLRIVTSKLGALPEVIGDAGLLLPGIAESSSYRHEFLGLTYAMMMDRTARNSFVGIGPERAALWTWDKSYEKVKSMVEGLVTV